MKRVSMLTTVLGASLLLSACGPSKKELKADLEDARSRLASTEAKAQSMEDKIAELEKEVAVAQAELARLEDARSMSEKELAMLRQQQKRREAELNTYRQLFAKLKKLVDTGKIKVVFRKGKMMVQLASAVLFDSGKTKLKPAGQEALSGLISALTSIDRDFLVAGHTDNVPIRTRRYESNWELSTARAVVVVDYLIEQGFPSPHLGAAGYADVDPVASNENKEGKANNRRIEIILMPAPAQVEGLREMIEGKKKS